MTSLSFRRNNAITAEGLAAIASLPNLVKLDLERCLEIHGGLVHLKGIYALNVVLFSFSPNGGNTMEPNGFHEFVKSGD